MQPAACSLHAKSTELHTENVQTSNIFLINFTLILYSFKTKLALFHYIYLIKKLVIWKEGDIQSEVMRQFSELDLNCSRATIIPRCDLCPENAYFLISKRKGKNTCWYSNPPPLDCKALQLQPLAASKIEGNTFERKRT